MPLPILILLMLRHFLGRNQAKHRRIALVFEGRFSQSFEMRSLCDKLKVNPGRYMLLLLSLFSQRLGCWCNTFLGWGIKEFKSVNNVPFCGGGFGLRRRASKYGC